MKNKKKLNLKPKNQTELVTLMIKLYKKQNYDVLVDVSLEDYYNDLSELNITEKHDEELNKAEDDLVYYICDVKNDTSASSFEAEINQGEVLNKLDQILMELSDININIVS